MGIALLAAVAGCAEPPPSGPQGSLPEATGALAPIGSAQPGQRGGGLPYEIADTQVFDVPDPVRGRDYQIYVSLPEGYAEHPDRRYPVVFTTDADYGFPMLRLIGRRMNGARPRIEDFILIGLSYAKGETGSQSRRRDYTPTANGHEDAPADAVHGEALAYRDYLRDAVFPFVEARWRTDPARRFFIGHSYGGLLGAQILLTDPGMFSGYVLGSPSLWYDGRYLLRKAPGLLAARPDIAARVYLYIGAFEAARKGDPRYYQTLDMVADNAAFARMLNARGYTGLALRSDVLDDEDHHSVAPRGFTKGLLYLLPAVQSQP